MMVAPPGMSRRRIPRSPAAGCDPVHSAATAHMNPGAAMMNPKARALSPNASCATTDSTIEAPKYTAAVTARALSAARRPDAARNVPAGMIATVAHAIAAPPITSIAADHDPSGTDSTAEPAASTRDHAHGAFSAAAFPVRSGM
jgi:hypothetical protein